MSRMWVPLAMLICDLLAKRHGAAYAADKRDALANLSTPDVLAWAVVHLDPTNQRELARHLGVQVEWFGPLRGVFDAARQAKRGVL